MYFILLLLLFDVKTIPVFLSYDLHTYTKKFVFSWFFVMISVKLLKRGSLVVLGEQKNTGVSPFIYTLKHPSLSYWYSPSSLYCRMKESNTTVSVRRHSFLLHYTQKGEPFLQKLN